jgi:hypothetical protein
VVSLVEPSQRREVSALLRKAGIEAAEHHVAPDHAEVLAIAASGDPIQVVALVPAKTDRPKDAVRRGGRPPRQGHSGSQGSTSQGGRTAQGSARPSTGRPRRLRAVG